MNQYRDIRYDTIYRAIASWCVRRHGGALSPTGRIQAFQVTIYEIIIAGRHCLCMRSVPPSNARVETCIGAKYHTMISGRRDIIRLMNPWSISHNQHEPYLVMTRLEVSQCWQVCIVWSCDPNIWPQNCKMSSYVTPVQPSCQL